MTTLTYKERMSKKEKSVHAVAGLTAIGAGTAAFMSRNSLADTVQKQHLDKLDGFSKAAATSPGKAAGYASATANKHITTDPKRLAEKTAKSSQRAALRLNRNPDMLNGKGKALLEALDAKHEMANHMAKSKETAKAITNAKRFKKPLAIVAGISSAVGGVMAFRRHRRNKATAKALES